ncbi:NADP-dependent oxidoreductase [Chitinophaga rhizophila]|uniref:NADP-dependent oxidoreductase n=1 Tax=Chitinophaga rhizophila TaxID=2866212 RepID=A0ABS7GKT6_9BACT|nr:NADP-dependent oxidoreductase [Chitinophaga rhizophila]MBW8688344.1 NADP-dependent oxidoreductase [Chitinophaga rhizophila]
MKTKQIVLASRPSGTPELSNFNTKEITLPELKEGEILLKGLFYSVDPYMRGKMNDKKSYTPPFKLDEPIDGGVVAEVVESKSGKFGKGDVVMGQLPWQELIITAEKGLKKIDANIAPASYYLGILGMPGLTAYIGFTEIGKPKAGETVVVSGAAGAVGTVVGQIAKLKGCKVIGIAGTDEKIAVMKEKFGYDEGINYKSTKDMNKAIQEHCPDGVDIYFDNVGGEVSDAVMSNLNFHARVPVCGQISLYNSKEVETGPRLQPILVTKSVLMQGFIVSNYQSLFEESSKQMAEWVKEGKLQSTETIIEGFDKLPEALLGLFKGDNTGKMIVKA